MSQQILTKLTQIGTNLATMTVLVSAPSVQAATLFYDLNFFDYSGEQVGSGSFSYDDTAPFEGTFIAPSYPFENVTISANEGWYKLLSFDAQVNGLNWDIGDSLGGKEALFWQPFNGEKPASVIRDRFGIPYKTQSQWFLGDPRSIPFFLVESNGWVQFESSSENIPTGIISGRWVATQRQTSTPVPEPSSIFSLMIFGAGSLIMASKTYKN